MTDERPPPPPAALFECVMLMEVWDRMGHEGRRVLQSTPVEFPADGGMVLATAAGFAFFVVREMRTWGLVTATPVQGNGVAVRLGDSVTVAVKDPNFQGGWFTP